jgi:hypothetical protein
MSNKIASSPDFIVILAMTVDFPGFVQLTSRSHITCRVIASPTKKGEAISSSHPPSLLRVIASPTQEVEAILNFHPETIL